MKYVLVDSEENWTNFLPLTYLKPIGELRLGGSLLKEKWERLLNESVSTSSLYYLDTNIGEVHIAINSTVLPTIELVEEIKTLKPGQQLIFDSAVIASFKNDCELSDRTTATHCQFISTAIELLDHLNTQIILDIKSRQGQTFKSCEDTFSAIYKPEEVYISSSVSITNATLDARQGPIYLGENVQIHAGAVINGPAYIGAGTHVTSNTIIRGGVACGKSCVLGGEIKHVQFQDYSHKGHYGYLGDSLVGSKCNFGAGTTSSNLKNNYSPIRVWSYSKKEFINSERTKLGLIMGDYTHTAIGSMLNTGSIIGLFANVFGQPPLPKFIDAFTWGVTKKYEWNKAVQLVSNLHNIKEIPLAENELDLLKSAFDINSK